MSKTRPITTRWAAECAVKFMKALRGKLESLTDDEQAVRDTIEGETDVDAVMERLIGLRQEAKAMSLARSELANSYILAAKADKAKAEAIEALMLECLQACGQESWTGAAGTASIRLGGLSCDIYDPTLIPLEFTKPVPEVGKIRERLLDARNSLTADGVTIDDLVKIANEEGLVMQDSDSRDALINWILLRAVPGARLVRGSDGLAIRLPGGALKKEKAQAA